MRPSFRHLRRALFALVAGVLSIELVSMAELKRAGDWPPRKFIEDYRAGADPWLRLGRWYAPLAANPYFGYQRDPFIDSAANNYGFQSDLQYPYSRQADEFVIAILGGSVAEWFAVHARARGYFVELSRRSPALKGKRIVVLDFALPGGKQPQQFFIGSYFARSVDLLLNLDGFNELLPRIFEDHKFPSDYPIFPVYRFLYPGAPTGIDRLAVNFVHSARNWISAAPIHIPGLAWSGSYRLLWHGIQRVDHLLITAFERRALQRSDRAAIRGRPGDKSGEVTVSEVVDTWARYTRLEQELARLEGVRSISFIQPNQYYRPPPLLDASSLARITNHPGLSAGRQELVAGYQALIQRANKLSRQGFTIFDLTDSFERSKSSPYVDNCCHLTDDAEAILAKRIEDILVSQLSTD